MTRRHYEMTEETATFNGRILHRIRAVEAFQNGIFGLVQAGALGGWIESENSLLDDAWVDGNARVSGSARVSGHAWVTGSARVDGNARVSGYAHIRQHGYIQSTNDYLTIGPIGSRNGYTTFYKTKGHDIWICCGCFNGSIDDFRTRVHEVHASTRHERDYLDAADFAARKLGKETEA